MHTRHPLASIWMLTTVVFLLGACNEPEEPEQAVSNSIIVKPEPVKPSAKSKEESTCSYIAATDIDAALGGKLPFGLPKNIRNGCSFPVQFGVNGNFLSYSKLSRGNYDANKNWEKQKGIKFEYINGLGQQAFILNDAQVCVLLNETDAFIVRAQIISMDEELPFTQAELGAGLIEIARKIEPHF